MKLLGKTDSEHHSLLRVVTQNYALFARALPFVPFLKCVIFCIIVIIVNMTLFASHKYKLDGVSRAIADFAREGYLGFQDHGHPVWYRNVKILPLEEETEE